MPKDLREMLRNEQIGTSDLSKNHRKNFESRLQKELHPSKKKRYQFLRIAASFLIVVGLGSSIFFFSTNSVEDTVETAKIESLGSISPELQKIENYYLASIQVELSNLEETPENKELLDSFEKSIFFKNPSSMMSSSERIKSQSPLEFSIALLTESL